MERSGAPLMPPLLLTSWVLFLSTLAVVSHPTHAFQKCAPLPSITEWLSFNFRHSDTQLIPKHWDKLSLFDTWLVANKTLKSELHSASGSGSSASFLLWCSSARLRIHQPNSSQHLSLLCVPLRTR